MEEELPPEQRGGARPRRGRPGLPALHPAWIVTIGACAVLFRVAMASGLNNDVYWQLAAGNWMLGHHAVIRHDVFSYTVPGHPWFAEEWGFEVLLAWMVRHVGPVSYWLVSAGATSGALLLSAARCRRLGSGQLWTAALAIMVAGGLVIGVAPRPQDLSYLFFAFELLTLTLARRDRRWLLALPPLLLLWANLHGSFLFGLAVFGFDVAASAVARARQPGPAAPGGARELRVRGRVGVGAPLPARWGAASFAASLIAPVVNPHGLGLYRYAFHVGTTSKLNGIEEWQSPNFHDPVLLVFVALPAVVAAVWLASSRQRVELFDLVVWAVLLIATLRAVRFGPYMVIALAGVLAPWKVVPKETLRASRVAPLAALALVALIVSPHHPPAGAPTTRGSGAVPVRAAAWLRAQGGRVFSTYVWNDYLIHVGVPDFVDGRTDMYFGTGVLDTYTKVSSLSQAPDPVFDRYGVRWVLWPRGDALSTYLAQDPRWHVARRFGPDLVFERVSDHSQ